MQKLAWSWSRLSKFEQCPKLFQGLFITKEIQMDSDATPLVKGREAHEALEHVMKALIIGNEPTYPDHLTHVEPLHRKLISASNINNIYVEQQIAFDEQMQQVGWYNTYPPVWLRVIYDLVAIDKAAKHAMIIDYKTGKKAHVEYGRSQLALFAMTAFAIYPHVDTVSTCYLWLNHKLKTAEVYTRAQYDNLMQEFGGRSELIQMAAASGNWEPKQNRQCRWCPGGPTFCHLHPEHIPF